MLGPAAPGTALLTYVDALCDYSPRRGVWRQYLQEHAQLLDLHVPGVPRLLL